MYTCYLFTDNFDDENCLSIRLNSAGEVDAELAVRSIDDFRVIQEDAKTVIVVSAEQTAIHSLELPSISANKARSVISYALEESLAESVISSHFAFSKHHYVNGHYLVAVIDKAILQSLQLNLERLQVEYDVITCDWFALSFGESCVIANRYLVNDVNFKGALSLDLFDVYLDAQTDLSHILMFNDSPALQHSEKFTRVKMDTYEWLACRLHDKKPINFCQGDYTHKTNKDTAKKYYKFAAYLAGGWLGTLLLSKIILIFVLNHNLNIYDAKISDLYRKFFPDAKQVISPKFRINQALHQNQAGFDAKFWKLLANFSNSVRVYLLHNPRQKENNHDFVIIKQIRSQNNRLEISLLCSDFEVLEKIETNLKKQSVGVKKAGVSTKGDKIIATLELS